MRAAVFYERGDVRGEDVPEPEAGPGEVLVRTGAALACGTDVKTYGRGRPTPIRSVPSPFGHGFGGTVEAPERHGRREGVEYEIQPPDGDPS